MVRCSFSKTKKTDFESPEVNYMLDKEQRHMSNLQSILKQLGIKGYSKMNRSQSLSVVASLINKEYTDGTILLVNNNSKIITTMEEINNG